MKIKLMALIIFTIILCSCSYYTNTENSDTENISVSVNSGEEQNLPCNPILENTFETHLDRILDFITKENMQSGCFYDFDKDGYPELVNIQFGETFYSYLIYNIKGETPLHIGTITVDDTEYANIEFSLYRDEISKEMFYLGEDRTIFWGENKNDVANIYIFKFRDNYIEQDSIGYYSYKPYLSDSLKIYIEDNNFMGKEIEAGYYDKSNLLNVLGINEYLSKCEKIENVNLCAQWNNFDENLEDNVKDNLMMFY